MSISGVLSGLVTRLVWLAIAVLVALGGAGIVATINHVPGTPARAELTWAGDRETTPAIDAAAANLQGLADDVDALSETARLALTAMVGSDTATLHDAIDKGVTQLADVAKQADTFEAALGEVPNTGPDSALYISPEVRAQFDQLSTAVGVTKGLEESWAAFTGQALDAASLTGLLARHDKETAAAAKEGTAGHYKAALALLDIADATIVEERTLADRLGKRADVSTLNGWIDRNATYDGALRTLYNALLNSKGRVTADVRAAFDAEKTARAALPGDTKAMVVIMSDLAQGGLDQALIAIEQARGSLSGIIGAQRALSGTGAGQ